MADPADLTVGSILIDHAADMQRHLDQLASELLALAVATLALAVVVTLIGVKLWV